MRNYKPGDKVKILNSYWWSEYKNKVITLTRKITSNDAWLCEENCFWWRECHFTSIEPKKKLTFADFAAKQNEQ